MHREDGGEGGVQHVRDGVDGDRGPLRCGQRGVSVSSATATSSGGGSMPLVTMKQQTLFSKRGAERLQAPREGLCLLHVGDLRVAQNLHPAGVDVLVDSRQGEARLLDAGVFDEPVQPLLSRPEPQVELLKGLEEILHRDPGVDFLAGEGLHAFTGGSTMQTPSRSLYEDRRPSRLQALEQQERGIIFVQEEKGVLIGVRGLGWNRSRRRLSWSPRAARLGGGSSSASSSAASGARADTPPAAREPLGLVLF